MVQALKGSSSGVQIYGGFKDHVYVFKGTSASFPNFVFL